MTPFSKLCTVCGLPFNTKAYTKTICSPECRVKEMAQEFSDSSICWPWRKSINKVTGYGQLSNWAEGKRTLLTAHRVSYAAYKGPIPDGMFVCHSCDNPNCFNPSHLFLGTQFDNMADMWSKGRGVHVNAKIHWTKTKPHLLKRGVEHHLSKDSSCLPRGSSHHQSKLNEAAVLEIRASQDKGVVLAKRFGVSCAVISAVRTRRTWRHL